MVDLFGGNCFGKYDYTTVIETMKMYGMFENIYLNSGDISEIGFKYFPKEISLLNIDVNFYQAAYDSLINFYHRVKPGGIVILNNYNSENYDCGEAIDQFLLENNVMGKLSKINDYHYFIKKEKTYIDINTMGTKNYLSQNNVLNYLLYFEERPDINEDIVNMLD